MNWTKEIPSKPGFYWAKEKNMEYVTIIEYCEFDIKVVRGLTHNKIFYEMRNECPINPRIYDLFCGPLKEPK